MDSKMFAKPQSDRRDIIGGSDARKLGEHLGHRQMQVKYRKEHGALEFYALALFTRTVLKIF